MGTNQTVQIGDVLCDGFRVEGRIGEGGMGVVFLATNLSTGAPCAVKVILPHLAARPGVLEKFETEANVGGKIGRSPYIADVFFAGVDAARQLPMLGMELFTGDSLAKHVERGPLDAVLARTLLDQLAEALDQAHAAGIVHRYLKPSNLHVTFDRRERPVLKVLDFGLAKALEGDMHTTIAEIGTPMYAAPEQLGPALRQEAAARGVTIADVVSPQTDIWSLGMIVLEMIAGLRAETFWDVATADDLQHAMVAALRERPRATARAGDRAYLLPAGFDAWFARCTELDATKRWRSASDAAAGFLALYNEHRKPSIAPPPLRAAVAAPAPAVQKVAPARIEALDARKSSKPRRAPASRASANGMFAVGVVMVLTGIAGVVVALGGGVSSLSAGTPAPVASAAPPKAEPAAPAPSASGVAENAATAPDTCAAGTHLVTGTGCVPDVAAGQAANAPGASSRSPAAPAASGRLPPGASARLPPGTSARLPGAAASAAPSAAPAAPELDDDSIAAAGLIWQKHRAREMNWADAKGYCASRPGGAWRLPSKDELLALFRSGAVERSRFYWSGTSVTGMVSDAWGVDFDLGGASTRDTGGTNYVRCVR